MKLELLKEVPIVSLTTNKVSDSYPNDKVGSINNLYKEAQAVSVRSLKCSMAAYITVW